MRSRDASSGDKGIVAPYIDLGLRSSSSWLLLRLPTTGSFRVGLRCKLHLTFVYRTPGKADAHAVLARS